nr:hypothetical protein [Tanacetum cinerariifolium]
MAGSTVKDMTTNFRKLDKFEGHDFRRWQKKMHFLLTTLKLVYVLTTPMLELLEDATVEAIRIRAKWENDDDICKGHILNDDSSSKKILVSNFNNYKMVDSRPVMEQYNELLRILGQYTHHGLKMDESISVLKESLTAQDSDKGKGKEVSGPSVNMIEEDGNNKHHKQNKGDRRSGKKNNVNTGGSGKGLRTNPKTKFDAIALWVDSGATTHVCKDR